MATTNYFRHLVLSPLLFAFAVHHRTQKVQQVSLDCMKIITCSIKLYEDCYDTCSNSYVFTLVANVSLLIFILIHCMEVVISQVCHNKQGKFGTFWHFSGSSVSQKRRICFQCKSNTCNVLHLMMKRKVQLRLLFKLFIFFV